MSNMCAKSSESIPSSIVALENSKWAKAANSPATQKMLTSQVPKLLGKLGNSRIAERARQAYELFNSSKTGGKDILTPRNIAVLGAALLYFVFPIDVIPDVIPVIGWLDDIGVLGLAVEFIFSQRKNVPNPEEAAALAVGNEFAQAEKMEDRLQFVPSPLISQDWDVLDQLSADGNDEETVEEIREWADFAQDPLRRVVFAGGFSAGKSSLINALLGEKLLKTSPLPCTPVLTSIIAGKGSHHAAIWSLKDGGMEIWDDISKVADFDEEMARKATELTITYKSDLLENGLTLVDTCGLESTEHAVIPVDKLPRSAAFVFVKSAKVGSLTKDEYAFFNQVLEKITGDQLIVVLNMADLVTEDDIRCLKEQMEKNLAERGVKGVRFFATSAREEGGNRYELDQLRRELLLRAQTSIPAREEEIAKAGMEEIRQRAKEREQLRQMKAEERREFLEKERQKAKATLTKIRYAAEDLKEALTQKLLDRVEVELMPLVRHTVDNNPMNEDTARAVRDMCRNTLSTFVKESSQLISQKLQSTCSHDELLQAVSATQQIRSTAPESKERLIRESGSYIMPGISILSFVTMGPFGWFTSTALPTLVMHKMGLGQALADIIAEYGVAERARAEFKKSVKRELEAAAASITDNISKMIDNCLTEQEKLLQNNL